MPSETSRASYPDSSGNALQIPEVLISREENGFRVIEISGGEYVLNDNAALIFLASHGRKDAGEVSDRVNKIKSMPRKVVEDCVDGFLKNDIIEFRPPKLKNDPFDTEAVIRNMLERTELKALSIRSITVSPSLKCNYQCNGCYAKADDQTSDEIDLHYFLEALDDVRGLGGSICAIAGGEPTHDKTIGKTLAITRHAKKLGFEDITLLTSGFNVTKYMDELAEAGTTQIQISLDSMGEYHNRYRGHPEALKRALKAVDSCKERRMPFGINTTMSMDNLDEVEDIIKYAAENSAKAVSINPFVFTGRARANDLKIIPANIREMRKLLEKIGGKYAGRLKIESSIHDEITGPMACRAGVSTVYLAENGNLSGCNHLIDTPAGNITEARLDGIWSYSDVFNGMRGIKEINAACNECYERRDCVMKCKAIAKSYFGTMDMDRPVEACWK